MRSLVVALSMLLALPAFGQASFEDIEPEMHHPQRDLELHEQFYVRWTRPVKPHSSCCSLGDCYPTTARAGNKTQWAFLRREDQKWIDVPDELVETRKEFQAPDGRAHVCAANPEKVQAAPIYCFHPPSTN